MRMLARKDYDFVFAIGDDWTDEFMFQELPDEAITVKVGRMKTHAKYFLKGIPAARALISRFTEI
jgi:trehalose 6-phosphate synthase/phosphatase